MPRKSLILSAITLIVIPGFVATAGPAFAAGKEKVLYSFWCSPRGCPGDELWGGGVIFDATGNLYGVTYQGGAYEQGAVFELMPGADGAWTEKTLHSFGNHDDGDGPWGPLVFDAAGNLYGITVSGGGAYSLGVAFQLTPGADGRWTEKVLHSFRDGRDGAEPWAGLLVDAAGNLYGTTVLGGAYNEGCNSYGCGTAFELSPSRDGRWTERVIHSFRNNGKDGFAPAASLTMDQVGNLYGTASGGRCGCGIVFQLTPSKNGHWQERVIHSFDINGGEFPTWNLTFDAAGNLYGTTVGGGAFGNGTVFRLVPSSNGKWKEELLRSFHRERIAYGGVIIDAAGNLYAATWTGGSYGSGTVFELSPGANGKWTETTLHSFDGTDGSAPTGSLIFDSAGNVYGTTQYGGRIHDQYCGGFGCGVVYEVTP